MIKHLYEATQRNVKEWIKENYGIEKPIRFWNGNFFCSDNQLTSLEGCPSEVGGYFDCSSNQLTSLEGCPSEVGGNFSCRNNQLTSLEGCPSEVGGDFSCYYNKRKFTEDEVRAVCNVKGSIYV